MFLQPNPDDEYADSDCFKFTCDSPGISGLWIKDANGSTLLVLGTERGEALLFDFSTDTVGIQSMPSEVKSQSPIMCFTSVVIEAPTPHCLLIAGRHDGSFNIWSLAPGAQAVVVQHNITDYKFAIQGVSATLTAPGTGALLQLVTTDGILAMWSLSRSLESIEASQVSNIYEPATYHACHIGDESTVCCGQGVVNVFITDRTTRDIEQKISLMADGVVFTAARLIENDRGRFVVAIDVQGRIYMKTLTAAAPNVIIPFVDEDQTEQKLTTRGVSIIAEERGATMYDCQNWMVKVRL